MVDLGQAYSEWERFNNNNNNQHSRIRINDYEIDEVEETKFLGVTDTIDNKLTWLPHLKLLAKKIRCCSGQLNRIKISCPNTYTKSYNLISHLI